MSEFCLLAAQLLNQRQLPGWKLAAPAPPAATAWAKPCQTAKGKPTPIGQRPESVPQQFSDRVTPPTAVAVATRPVPPLIRSPLPTLDATGQAYLPFSAPPLRPSTGSQLYQQRVMALRSGRVYTRISADSYPNDWMRATTQPTHEQWVRLLAAEAGSIGRGQGGNRLTVMVGDSLYLWYPQEQLAGDRFWLNQGISGDTTTGVLRRLRAFAQTRPDRIQVMVGINDLRRGATDSQVLNNLRQIMRQLRHNHPHAQIFVQSILPTRLAAIPPDRIWRINDRLAQITRQESVNFVDLQQYFADDSGSLRNDLTTDGLHLNSRGYAMWQTALHAANPAL